MTRPPTDRTLNALFELVTHILSPAGFADAAREAELLTAAVLDRSVGELNLDRMLERTVDDSRWQRVQAAAWRRARREPLQHIIGSAPFLDVELAVGPGVFVPRPETESLVEFANGELEGSSGVVVDIGAGSGAIAIGIARANTQLDVVALEASPHAWPWLQRNIRRFAPGVHPHFGDWRRTLPDAELAAICSNPPYVPIRAVPSDPEVRCFDPSMALYSGADGLTEIRQIAAAAASTLRPDGFLIVEHTETQGTDVRRCLNDRGLVRTRTLTDLTQRPRFTVGWQPQREH